MAMWKALGGLNYRYVATRARCGPSKTSVGALRGGSVWSSPAGNGGVFTGSSAHLANKRGLNDAKRVWYVCACVVSAKSN